MAKGLIEWELSEEEGLTLHIKPALGKMVSAEVRQHAGAAQRELLLALRGIIDMTVKNMEAKESTHKQGSTKIKVE